MILSSEFCKKIDCGFQKETLKKLGWALMQCFSAAVLLVEVWDCVLSFWRSVCSFKRAVLSATGDWAVHGTVTQAQVTQTSQCAHVSQSYPKCSREPSHFNVATTEPPKIFFDSPFIRTKTLETFFPNTWFLFLFEAWELQDLQVLLLLQMGVCVWVCDCGCVCVCACMGVFLLRVIFPYQRRRSTEHSSFVKREKL